jgi:pyruvate formate lyase activating enzyme
MQHARFYNQLDNKTVQCRLCGHLCVIKNRDMGICQVRRNHNGRLQTYVYGYPCAQNIDPIEKKPLFHFYPASHTYSLGTLGCNLKCANCQNWDMSQAKAIDSRIKKMDFIYPEKIIEEALGSDCRSISYTYNEPTIFAEYALDIMKLAHEYELKNVWVSNGYMSEECLQEILPYLDAINIDLKSFDQNFYRDNCEAKLEPILRNLKILKNEQVHLEVTTLIIPGLSDDIKNITDIIDFIANELDVDTPWHISKFSPSVSWKLKKLEPTGDDILYEAFELGKEAGLKYVYVGNLPGDQKESTYCPACSELAIRRLGYSIERLDNEGHCAYCDKSLDIIE